MFCKQFVVDHELNLQGSARTERLVMRVLAREIQAGKNYILLIARYVLKGGEDSAVSIK